MLVSELITSVRDQLLERNKDVIDDKLIVRRLNDSYRFVYNKFAKSNDNMFGRNLYITVEPGRMEYPLPKELWNKRVETFEVPNPPTSGGTSPNQVFSYVKVQKSSRQQQAYYDAPAYRSMIPLRWVQYDNKIRLMPPPSVGYRARVFHVPRLVELAVPQGRIIDIIGNRVYLDTSVSEDIIDALNAPDAAYMSISCFQTGSHKAMYKFSAADSNVLTLGSTTRESYHGCDVYSVNIGVVKSISMVDSLLTANIGAHSFKVGDYVEFERTADASFKYRVQDLYTGDAFLNPPEFDSLPDNTIARGGRIFAVTTTTISWIDATYQPLYVNGYRYGQTPSARTVTSVVGTGSTSTDFYNVTFPTAIAGATVAGGAWNVKVGDKIRVTMSGTGAADSYVNVANYVAAVVTGTNTLQLLITPPGAGNSGFVGSVNLAPLSSAWTGTPQLYYDSAGTPQVEYAKVYSNTPYSLAQQNDVPNDPDAYDSVDNIELDDIVTLGYSTGCSVLGEAFSEFLWKRSLLAIRGSLNENDPEINKQIRQLEEDVTGDTAGRPLGRRVERVFGPANSYRRPMRR